MDAREGPKLFSDSGPGVLFSSPLLSAAGTDRLERPFSSSVTGASASFLDPPPPPPPAAEQGGALSPLTHTAPALQTCAFNPGGQVFSLADFQGLQDFLDAQDHWADVSIVYIEFDFGSKALKAGL